MMMNTKFIKASENNRQSITMNMRKKCYEIDEQSEGVIGLFINNKLRITEKNCDFQ